MNKPTNISSIIKKIRKENNLTQKEFGEKIGVAEGTVSLYESGDRSPKMKKIQLIADKFGYSASEIVFGKELYSGESTTSYVAESITPYGSSSSNTEITVYGRICAGDGKLAYEDITDTIYNPYPRINGDLIALQVDGESMNRIIPNNAYAIIKRQRSIRNGQIAAIIIDGEEAMLKRFYRPDEETVLLKPESHDPNFKPLSFMGEDINKIMIVGRYMGHVTPHEI